jgi:lipid II:glycine glycyltransferase (peptidoglycan interpeptide bridge formation enzyme)
MAWASPRGNWLPLFWRGFSQTTYYTYRLTDLSCTDRIFENMDYRVRRQINKARERESLTVSVSSDGEFEGLYELHKVVYLRQGRKPPHAREFLLQLDRACRERDRRRIFTARDREGRCHAAAYIVRDRDCAYYLYSGSDPDLRQSGALSLCLWSAIQYFSKDTRFFDFEGSMVPSIERHFRGFGAEQVPYFRISRSNSIIASLVERLRSQRNLRRRMAASPGT